MSRTAALQQAAGSGQSLADGGCQGLRTGSLDPTETYRNGRQVLFVELC